MAENNSSAPLKTAEGAYPALPKPAYPAQFNGHGGEQSSDEGYSAEQMRAYAAQAVAAQAPAAVAVPEITDAMVDAYLAEQRRTVEDADRFGRPNIGGLHTNTVRESCRNGLRAALTATPATEYSSAGDLARHGMTPRDKATQDQIAAVMLQHGTPEQQRQALATCCKVSTESIKAIVAATQAVMQAEPLCWVFEDELPASLTTEAYNALFAHSKVDGVRMFPVFGPQPAPQAQPADALTQAALDVLAERRRQVEVEGWTPERDDQYVHGDMSSAAGCYAMFTQAYPKGDPHHSWPWDKAWWKPSKDARRNRIKACALLLAEIERLDRAAMAAAQEGGKG